MASPCFAGASGAFLSLARSGEGLLVWACVASALEPVMLVGAAPAEVHIAEPPRDLFAPTVGDLRRRGVPLFDHRRKRGIAVAGLTGGDGELTLLHA
eukprot:10705339-Alexandrium_andersonii.AAC.1